MEVEEERATVMGISDDKGNGDNTAMNLAVPAVTSEV
jgi:hypothetical protein